MLLSPGDLSKLMNQLIRGKAKNQNPHLCKPPRLCLLMRPHSLPVMEITRFKITYGKNKINNKKLK